jgi:hypothetical protein
MGDIKDIIDLAIQLEGRAKDRKDIEPLRSIISLTQSVQSSQAEVVERDIRVMTENAQLVKEKAELKRQLDESQAEDVRIHSGIEFHRGKRTGGVWMPFCPQCKMPAIIDDNDLVACIKGYPWICGVSSAGLAAIIAAL